MRFQVAAELIYTLRDPATFLFALKCIETGGQHIESESLVIEPFHAIEDFTLPGGMNRFTRLITENSGGLRVSYMAEVNVSTRIDSVDSFQPDHTHKLLPEAITHLFPSRYCQSDRLREQAQDLFGHLKTPYEIAAGVSDWIHERVAYVSGSSSETCSAVDTLEKRVGVCRDFAHLGISFCRALHVPARYVTCYAYQLQPPDFHACFEVMINGVWYIFDATRLAPLNGLVRIATGRDAADAAVCSMSGNPEFQSSKVSCWLTDPDFIPVTRDTLAERREVIALL